MVYFSNEVDIWTELSSTRKPASRWKDEIFWLKLPEFWKIIQICVNNEKTDVIFTSKVEFLLYEMLILAYESLFLTFSWRHCPVNVFTCKWKLYSLSRSSKGVDVRCIELLSLAFLASNGDKWNAEIYKKVVCILHWSWEQFNISKVNYVQKTNFLVIGVSYRITDQSLISSN